MLRTTRPFLASSSRAIATWRQPTLLRRLPAQSAADNSLIAESLPSRAVLAQLSPIIHRSRYATKSASGMQVGIDPEEDEKLRKRKLKATPESVSEDSTVRHINELQRPSSSEAKPVKEGVKEDLEVPKEPYWLGLAGTLPYLGTSATTVYLSWVLNSHPMSHAANSFIIQHDTAQQLLSALEPLQVGYGAIIISFLGAIHWGMEYAATKPDAKRTRFRYGVGLLAPVMAWPTVLLPVEFALIAQFGAFVALYFADARATVRGWVPYWYGQYRFALTAIVGVAIAISLIGRAKVGSAKPRFSSVPERLHEERGAEPYDEKWEQREEQDKEKLRKEKEAAEKKKKEEEEKKKKAEAEAKAQKKGNEKKDKDGKKDEKKEEK
ncbi:hypothetical protein GGR56DRAFT_1669 [Xylariaceae sp. FL0804]|nr:hypothetical protein GGR56DRAFT_1669 [Xylariaceae sp. FL0804]